MSMQHVTLVTITVLFSWFAVDSHYTRRRDQQPRTAQHNPMRPYVPFSFITPPYLPLASIASQYVHRTFGLGDENRLNSIKHSDCLMSCSHINFVLIKITLIVHVRSCLHDNKCCFIYKWWRRNYFHTLNSRIWCILIEKRRKQI